MNREELDEQIKAIVADYWPTEPKTAAPEIADRIRNAVVEACAKVVDATSDHTYEAHVGRVSQSHAKKIRALSTAKADAKTAE